MPAAKLLTELGPYGRTAMAIVPLAVAILLRLLFGKNRLTGTLVSLCSMWFMANVLAAPFSISVQDELRRFIH